jgi:hypothetical protein
VGARIDSGARRGEERKNAEFECEPADELTVAELVDALEEIRDWMSSEHWEIRYLWFVSDGEDCRLDIAPNLLLRLGALPLDVLVM